MLAGVSLRREDELSPASRPSKTAFQKPERPASVRKTAGGGGGWQRKGTGGRGGLVPRAPGLTSAQGITTKIPWSKIIVCVCLVFVSGVVC